MVWTCPNLQCPYDGIGEKDEHCPLCGTALENFGEWSFQASSYTDLQTRKQELGRKGAYAQFESRRNIPAEYIVNGRIKPRDAQDRYVILIDVAELSFNMLQQAINIFAREGWRVVSFQVSNQLRDGRATGFKKAYVIMENVNA